MIATAHLAVGAAAGLWGAKLAGGLVDSESEWVRTAVQAGSALLAGTASHFVLDAIPHNEFIYETVYKAPVLKTELLVSFFVISWLVYSRNLNPLVIFMGIVGGAWPDAIRMINIPLISDSALLYRIENFHSYVHSAFTPEPFPSLPIQILVAVVALIFLF